MVPYMQHHAGEPDHALALGTCVIGCVLHTGTAARQCNGGDATFCPISEAILYLQGTDRDEGPCPSPSVFLSSPWISCSAHPPALSPPRRDHPSSQLIRPPAHPCSVQNVHMYSAIHVKCVYVCCV